jgi:hypothetical protein
MAGVDSSAPVIQFSDVRFRGRKTIELRIRLFLLPRHTVSFMRPKAAGQNFKSF